MNPEDLGRTDFIIIGSGIAGLYTALHLADAGRVTVISKLDLCAGNTRFAQGGVAAAFYENDSPELHLEDTWRAGGAFGDRAAIGVMVREAPEVIADLIKRGVKFDSRNGAVLLSREGFHSRNRIWHIGGDATGKELLKVLLRDSKKKKIHFYENSFVEHLLTGESGCCGVSFIKGGKRFLLQAGAVILASGDAVKYIVIQPAPMRVPVTDWRWLTGPALSCVTWSSFNFTRPYSSRRAEIPS